MSKLPLVSVCMITYGHENYIAQAIEGVLMQKCSFDIELIIADDSSPDNTSTIVEKYIKKHSLGTCISYTRHESNKGVIANFKWALNNCRGKYIAICEGDDYWTDPFKLKKQVDFLECNPQYVLSHTDCDFLYAHNGKVEVSVNKYNFSNSDSESLFYALLSYDLKIRTASTLIRSDSLNFHIPEVYRMVDMVLWLNLSQRGKFHYINESTCLYRIHEGSASRPKETIKEISFRLSGLDLRFFYCSFYNYKIPQKLIDKYNNLCIDYAIFNGNLDKLQHSELLNLETKRKISLCENKWNRFFGKIIYQMKRSPNLYLKFINIFKR